MPSQKNLEEERRELSLLMTRWDRDWRTARPYFDEFKDDYLAYKMYRDATSHPYKYNPVVPLVFTITENIVSTMFNAFTSKPNSVTIQPVERSHMLPGSLPDEAIARQLEKVVNIQLNHPEQEYLLDLYDLLMGTVLFGNGYTCTVPMFDKEQESELGGPLYIGPKVMPKDVWDIVPDREGYRFSNCRWITEKEWISEAELKRRIEREGYNKLKDEEIKRLTQERREDDEWEDFHEDVLRTLGKGARPWDGVDKKNGMLLLLHFYDTETGHYKTVAANRKIVRDTSMPIKIDTPFGSFDFAIPPYPYNPYDEMKLWPFPKEFFATGVGKIARGFQDDINLLKSMRLENLELAIHKVFLYNPLYGIDPDEMYMIPGAQWETRDVHNSVDVLKVEDVTQNAYTEQGMWEREAEDATAMQDIVRGNEPGRRETATMGTLMQRNALKRTETTIRRSAAWKQSVTLKHIIQMRTYMSQSEYERILGEPDAGFFQMELGDIKRMFDIQPSGAAIQQLREIEQQNYVNALQLMQPYMQFFNAPELAKLFFELFFPDKSPDKYVLNQPMMPQQGQQPPGAKPPGETGVGQNPISPQQLIQGALEGGTIGGP